MMVTGEIAWERFIFEEHALEEWFCKRRKEIRK